MSNPNEDLLAAFDGHRVDDVRAASSRRRSSHPFRASSRPTGCSNSTARSDALQECLRLLIDHGAEFRDPLIAPVVLNDPDAIRVAAQAHPSFVAIARRSPRRLRRWKTSPSSMWPRNTANSTPRGR